MKNAYKYYEEGDDSVLPRSIATREAFLNAMTLDIAMGGSTNTVLHLLAIAHEAEVDFRMDDIDMLSRRVPCLCKVAPNTQKYHIQDVNRAGGILGILGELSKGGLLDTSVRRVDGTTLAEAIARYDICGQTVDPEASASIPVHRAESSALRWEHSSSVMKRWIPTRGRMYPGSVSCLQPRRRTGCTERKHCS